MQNSKPEAYIGFCLRAGKLTAGINAAAAIRKGVYLLIADRSVSDNSRKEILSLKRKFGCPLVMTDGLAELVHKPCCKLAAIRDKSLAEAIFGEAGKGRITEYIGGMEE